MPRAASEAESLYRRVIDEAPLHGQEWYNRLFDALQSLSEMPERCRVMPNLGKPGAPIRRLLFGQRRQTYGIYFDIVEATVRILHIRHGARREPRIKEIHG